MMKYENKDELCLDGFADLTIEWNLGLGEGRGGGTDFLRIVSSQTVIHDEKKESFKIPCKNKYVYWWLKKTHSTTLFPDFPYLHENRI